MTLDEIISASRHVVSYAMGAATVFGITQLGGVSGNELQTGFDHVLNGVKEITIGLAPIISAAMGLWAAHGAKLQTRVAAVNAAQPAALVNAVQQVAPSVLRDAVAAQPEVKSVIVTTTAFANESASPKVKT